MIVAQVGIARGGFRHQFDLLLYAQTDLADFRAFPAPLGIAVHERCAGIDRHEWRIDQQTRLVSVDSVALADGRATTSSSVAIYRTDEDGRTACYAVARYEDDWRRAGGCWHLAERVVALRTRLLAIPSPLPL